LDFPPHDEVPCLYPTLFSGSSMTKTGKRLALVPVVMAGVVILFFLTMWACTPSLARYKDIRLPLDTAKAASQGLRVTFLGVSTLLIQDDTSSFITDAFFTRPGYLHVTRPLSPDRDMIRRVLDRLDGPDGKRFDSLRAVIPLHSHFDHAMDAPYVADTLNVRLIGSRSTQMVARSQGTRDSIPFELVEADSTKQVGGFWVTFIECVHGPPDRFPGTIDTPIGTSPKKKHYRTGNCFTLLVRHGTGSILVTGTAGFVPGALEGVRADVVYLSVGGLGEQDSIYRASYWREVVQTTGARRVVLIHWDNFFRSLFEPLVPLPRTPLKEYSDRFHTTFRDLCKFAERDTIDLRVAREWVAANPFERLADSTTRIAPTCPDP
jgi:L-ascorbate metabolism protein UlaG (beta-lactamase superfamily)